MIFVLFMVLAIAGVVVLAAELGMSDVRQEKRYEDGILAQRTWEAATSLIDDLEAKGSLTLPDSRSFTLNGVSGTLSTVDYSSTLANSIKVTSTLTTPDGRTYPETAILSKGGGQLNGSYWWTNNSSITTNANAWDWMFANGTPTGTFLSQLLNYTGNDSTLIGSWLSTDSTSYSGTSHNFEDGIVELYGYITIPTNNTVIQDTSDDGTYVSVDGDRWVINNDSTHSAQSATVTISTAGTYPIFVVFFNHSTGGGGISSLNLQWDTSGLQLGVYSAIPSSALQQIRQTWAFNGQAVSFGNGSELCNGNADSGTAWLTTKQTVSSFHASFDFTYGTTGANGMTFCIQNQGTTALGSTGTGMGYNGISTAVCLAFGTNNKTAVTTNSGNPATTDSTSPVSFSSGDTIHVALSYSGTTLAMALTDVDTGQTFSKNYTVNITSVVGASTAYVGFTAGNGPGPVNQEYVLNFNFGP